MTDIKKAFGIITDKLNDTLKGQNFKNEKVESSNPNELVSLFTSDTVAYSVIYYKDKMLCVLRSCTMTDEGPDNEWKTMATWMFNPETDTEKEADSIGNDFVEAVSSSTAVKRAKQTKRKKNSDDGNADPLFLAKRFMVLFPELKEEIKREQDTKEVFRGVYFTRTFIVPRVNELLARGVKSEVNKLSQILSTQYTNGDMDTRSIITIVILNSTDEKYREKLEEKMSDELKKAWKFALKMKGKKVKPEKVKKKSSMFSGSRL
ncbi:MAG: hypothetical protein IKK10_01810 [Clostridia bacterium]|nr:hypothetical protein [Clostridia bacterium]